MQTLRRRQSLLGRIVAIASAAALAAWIVFLRPQQFGGPAAYIVVSGVSMEPALTPGALVIATRQPSYDIGDIVVFRVPEGDIAAGSEVIHRVIGVSAADGYVVQGDNTDGPDRWHPRADEVVGKAFVAIPAVGPLLGVLRNPLIVAAVAALLVVSWALGGKLKASEAPIMVATATAPASPRDPAS